MKGSSVKYVRCLELEGGGEGVCEVVKLKAYWLVWGEEVHKLFLKVRYKTEIK